MASSALARRYSLALISLAKDENLLDQIGSDLDVFFAVWNEGNGLLKNALLNPGISVQEREGVLKSILTKLSLNAYLNNFLYLLLEKSRLSLLTEIVEAYGNMADEIAGKLRARVTTAIEVELAEKDRIRQTLAKASGVSPEKLTIKFDIDQDIIGGIVARVGDTIYDASLRSRLQDIKQTLI
jgi:F-type H+-transporting ATPase subunit delta